MPLNRLKTIIPWLFFAFIISGCMSLAEDITPPPGYISPTRAASTSTPEDTSAGVEPQSQTITYPVIPPDPVDGAEIYQEKCLPCHGQYGLGDGPQASQLPNPVPALADPDVARGASPADWYNIVSNGNIERFMPPFKSLSDRERWDVVAYLYTLSVDDEILAAGQAVFADQCAVCHGDRGQGGTGTNAQVFIDQSEMAFESHNSLFEHFGVIEEHTTLENVSDAEIHNTLEYVRRLMFTQPEVAEESQPQESEPEEVTIDVTPVAEVSEAEPGEIVQGMVSVQVGRPSGDSLPEGTEVILRGYDHMTEVYSTTASLEAEGLVEIADVPLPPGRILLATVDYEQASYGSNVYVIEEGDETVHLAISVYETTTDTSGLMVDRLHIFFDFIQQDVIQVVELYVISNPSDRTIIAENQGEPVLDFKLPPEATNLTFRDGVLGDRYIKTEAGFADTLNIRPGSGQYQVMFGYDVPYPRNRADLQLPIELPTTSVIVMAPEDGVKVRGDVLSFEDVRQVEGVTYQLLSSGMMEPGDMLEVSVSGWPRMDGGTAAIPPLENQNLLLGIGVLGGVLIAVGVFLWQRNRNQVLETDGDDDVSPDVSGSETPDDLIDAIIALDELYAAGELPEEAYNTRRADLKDRLNEILENEAEE